VQRQRLTARLDDAVRQNKRLTLICAPAGFRKTTLVTEWLANQTVPVAWLSLDTDDNDPVQFLNLLIGALQRIDPDIGQLLQQALRLPQAPPLHGLLTALINDIASRCPALLLVLDDYHLITDTTIHQAVEFLIERQPAAMHTVIISRTEPPLPLSRLRVRNQLTEIREHDLRFSQEECAAFFEQTADIRLSAESVRALEARTEGWIAGLQLAALALQGDSTDADNFISTFTGSDRFVADYLLGEAIRQQPPALQTFLRQTSILDRMNADVCTALTGREDSQTLLDSLHASNLFVIALDHQREWYRYYRLFAEFLRGTLAPDERAQQHRRAMAWHEANGFASRAIQHALACGALDDAERLIIGVADITFHNGNITTLAHWLEALPPARLRSNFDLAVMMGLICLITNCAAQAQEYADVAEHCGQQATAPAESIAKLLLLRAYIGLAERDDDSVRRYAASALTNLTQPHWRTTALWVMAEAQERTGNISESIVSLREAQRIGRSLGAVLFATMIEAFLASALNEQGRRGEAAAVCEQAVARFSDDKGLTLPIAGLILGRLLQEGGNEARDGIR
jgi:LuxR family maltose regulon positive regulatory protein